MMAAVFTGLWVIVVVLGALAWRRKGGVAFRETKDFTVRQITFLLPRLILAMLAATFAATLVPEAWIASMLGAQSGSTGILLAALLGGLMPAGPMVSFPVAMFLWQSGAGIPQMVALLCGWSVFGFHRVIAFELPMMGWRFTVIRMASTFMMPPLAGFAAAGVLAMLGDWSAAFRPEPG